MDAKGRKGTVWDREVGVKDGAIKGSIHLGFRGMHLRLWNVRKGGTVPEAYDSVLWRLRQESCKAGITGSYRHAWLPSMFFKGHLLCL